MRSTQARPDCSYRATQAGSGFGIRKITEIAEHDTLTIVIGERSHCGLHAPGEFSADHLRGQRIRFGNEFARQRREDGIFWERLVGPLAARDSPHKIASDAKGEGGEIAAILPIVVRFLQQSDENLLR